ncbi:MAG: methylmalonyl-CoA carboxyltransferase [Firmicutes bacterium]|nr:methylmalonyl-CoA carboxyltransferase [Bacillota bacterium]
MQEQINRLKDLRVRVQAGGGAKKIEKQHAAGKMTARERIAYFFDRDTFRELDVFAGDFERQPNEGVVTGYGLVNGRKVFIYAQDFTVNGGTLGAMHARKICKVFDLAMHSGAPVVGLNDSGGARIQESVASLNGFGELFYRNTMASGLIPQIAVIMGPCAGGAVYSPALMDFVFMVKDTSQMFITGPQVVKVVTGEEVSMELLGGALTHSQTSGVAHFMGEDEKHCLDMVKNLLSYLPDGSNEKPPLAAPAAPLLDREALLELVPVEPKYGYDIKKVIAALVDGGEFMEVLPLYARNAVTCFARFAGQPVGIVANQPDYLAGCLNINASDKISRFVRFCDAFNIPLLTFMDVPGFLPGAEQEYGGIIRHGAKILYAYAEATVPKVTVILRKAYGGAYIAMCSSSLRADIVYAWPTAEIAVMGPEAAVNIVNRKEIDAAADPESERIRLAREYREQYTNPFVAGALGYVDDVIDPRDTRSKIIDAFQILAAKQERRPSKKHGNLPV